MMKLSVVLPACNEAQNLKELLPEIHRVLGKGCEIIVVNDASRDDTASLAEASGAKVINNAYNMGNGAAVKRGIRESGGDIVVLMDADGQHLPAEIPKLLEGLENYDMVVGVRGARAQSWWRRLANAVYNLLASYVSGIKIKDLTSGFRAFRRDKALKFLHLLPNTFSYPSTLTLSFVKAAYSVKFVSVEVLKRKRGQSKINLINDGLRFLVIIMKITVFFSPLKVFLPVAAFFFLSGLAYYVYTFLLFHRFTNMSALLFTTSIIIFMLGLISEQIAHLKIEEPDRD